LFSHFVLCCSEKPRNGFAATLSKPCAGIGIEQEFASTRDLKLMETPNPETWTPAARRVVHLAHEESWRPRNGPTGTRDLLAALIFSGEGLGLVQLKRLGIPTSRLKQIWESWKPGLPEPVDAASPGETLAFRAALLAAVKNARQMGHGYLTCEHLLLGLLEDPQCEALQMLRDTRVERERCLEAVLLEFDWSDQEPGPVIPEGDPAGRALRPGWARRMANLARRYGLVLPANPGAGVPPGLRPFTPRAQRALDLARAEAHRRRLWPMDTDILLLGVLGVGQGCAIGALRRLGVDLELVRRRLLGDKTEGTGNASDTDPPPAISFSSDLKEALRQATAEAAMFSHAYVGTEHLVLGMLHGSGHPAARALSASGVVLEKFRDAVLDELDPGRSSGMSPAT